MPSSGRVCVADGASCGSSWDVVTGRVDWATWWAQDGADPLSASRPVRTQDCPGAMDSRLALAGLLAGLIRGLSLADAGRIAAAAGACCVTGLGATAGLRNWNETCKLAGIAR